MRETRVAIWGLPLLGLALGCGDGTAPPGSISANGQIAFVSTRDGNPEIYVMNADGSGQVNLTNSPAEDYGPAWSPDGRRIAFVSDRDGSDAIYVMNADGSGVTRITSNLSSAPAWSPDGARLAVAELVVRYNPRCNPCETYEIMVMNADGSGVVVLSSGRTYLDEPTWSPDGRRIAFTYGGEGVGAEQQGGVSNSAEIYVVNVDGTGLTNLTNSPAADDGAAWSPDGAKIAFASERGGVRELYVMNSDGGGVTHLTHDRASGVGRPTWSPDGKRIMFASTRGVNGNWQIYLMNADGSGVTRRTDNAADDQRPAWSR